MREVEERECFGLLSEQRRNGGRMLKLLSIPEIMIRKLRLLPESKYDHPSLDTEHMLRAANRTASTSISMRRPSPSYTLQRDLGS